MAVLLQQRDHRAVSGERCCVPRVSDCASRGNMDHALIARIKGSQIFSDFRGKPFPRRILDLGCGVSLPTVLGFASVDRGRRSWATG